MRKSLSSTWDGLRRMLTEKEALMEVLGFMWQAHGERRPTHEDQTMHLNLNLSKLCFLRLCCHVSCIFWPWPTVL